MQNTALDMAHAYMSIFFSGGAIQDLQLILDENFEFNGPFYRFSCTHDYIQSLTNDPPLNCGFEIYR